MFNFIGSGSAFNTTLGNNGAYIKHKDLLFMIDCGSITFDRLLKSGILEGVNHIDILITHTHPDHVGSLGDLIFYSYYSMGDSIGPKVTVFAPFDLNIRHILRKFGVTEDRYELCQFGDGEIAGSHYDDFHLQFEAVPVSHVDELNCYGYIFEYNNELIYYSGDSNEIPSDILAKLNTGKFVKFYQDTCKADYEGNVHLSLRELNEKVLPEVRHLVYCMHLDKGFSREEAEELGFNVVRSIF